MRTLITNQCPKCRRSGACACRIGINTNKRRARNATVTAPKTAPELAAFFEVDLDPGVDPSGYLSAIEAALQNALRMLREPAREEPSEEDVLGTEATVAGNRRRLSSADIALGLRSLAAEADRQQRQYVSNAAEDLEEIEAMIPTGWKHQEADYVSALAGNSSSFDEDDEIAAMRPKRFDPRTGKYVFC